MIKSYKVRDVAPGIFIKMGLIITAAIGVVLTYQSSSPLFIIFIVFPVFIIASYRGVEIDLLKQEFRPFLSVMGFRSGQRVKMPAIKYIVIKDTVFVTRNTRYGNSYDDTYEVALICEEHVKIPLFSSYDISETIAFATQEKQAFNCHIEDLTHEQITKNVSKA